jgi:hypothetical protein
MSIHPWARAPTLSRAFGAKGFYRLLSVEENNYSPEKLKRLYFFSGLSAGIQEAKQIAITILTMVR